MRRFGLRSAGPRRVGGSLSQLRFIDRLSLPKRCWRDENIAVNLGNSTVERDNARDCASHANLVTRTSSATRRFRLPGNDELFQTIYGVDTVDGVFTKLKEHGFLCVFILLRTSPIHAWDSGRNLFRLFMRVIINILGILCIGIMWIVRIFAPSISHERLKIRSPENRILLAFD